MRLIIDLVEQIIYAVDGAYKGRSPHHGSGVACNANSEE
jgi:hypothetical protein